MKFLLVLLLVQLVVGKYGNYSGIVFSNFTILSSQHYLKSKKKEELNLAQSKHVLGIVISTLKRVHVTALRVRKAA